MISTKLILGSMALILAAGTPAFAQNHMMASGGKGMSRMQMASMHRCQAMSHRMMMRNRKCAAMMKMHPDMMHNAGMANHGMMGKKH